MTTFPGSSKPSEPPGGSRKIILGVSGGIGAYKAALVLRLLQKEGFEIFPVMTRNARQFITPLTLEKLSGNRVISDLFARPAGAGGPSPEIEHIALARRSDLLLVAPATANLLAKFAHGIADDFLSTLYLSTITPVVVAPAMNVEMWQHPAVQENLAVLRRRGVTIIAPGSGYQACGEFGEGRLAEPEQIRDVVLGMWRRSRVLSGRQVLVTAGPTQEPIDPVRYLSNRSSGKMGVAMASEALRRGARVTLVIGPSTVDPPDGATVIRVRTAAEMAEAVLDRFEENEIIIMTAAVADFTPLQTAEQKMKKEDGPPSLALRPTLDILQELGRRRSRQFLVGFAAESGDLRRWAFQKLEEKNLDLVVANDISGSDRGFEVDQNEVLIVGRQDFEEQLPLLSKAETAALIWDRIEQQLALSIRPDPVQP